MRGNIWRAAALLAGLSAPGAFAAEQVYLWADQPEADSYTPSASYAGALNTETPAITIRRDGPGAYAVRFDGGFLQGAEGNIQVSAYSGDPSVCTVRSWGGGSANVRCFDAQGRAADSRFALLATRAAEGEDGVSYAWVDPSAAAPASYAHAPDGAVSTRRVSTGRYAVTLPGALARGGNVQVTAYGVGAKSCHVLSWGAGMANVQCTDSAGAALDTPFTLLATEADYAPEGGRLSYVWANEPGSDSYAPSLTYALTEADAPEITRRGEGHYEVRIGGLVTGGGGVQVSAYGAPARCAPAGWGGGGVVVRCFSAAGAPMDAQFSLLAVRGGVSAGSSASDGGLTFETAVAAGIAAPVITPTITYEINPVEHLCINTFCEFGEEGWDKTPSEQDYDGTSETSFVPDLENATLERLCPVRRRTTDREFGGNGPAVSARTSIEGGPDRLELIASMSAEETGSGTSLAFKTWRGEMFTPPEGWIISGFDPRHSETSYTDTDHEEDLPPVRGGTLAAAFRIKGDTGGDDIGNCTEDDTYMTIAYNPVTVRITKQTGGQEMLRLPSGVWTLALASQLRRLVITLNNYDATASQPENGVSENRYFVDRTDRAAWPELSEDEVRLGSFFEFRASSTNADDAIAPSPISVPAIRRNTFTFLINDIVSTGRRNSAEPAGDHIKLQIFFDSTGPEIVSACIDNIACGSGPPHEAGKPLVQADSLVMTPYVRPRVIEEDGRRIIQAHIERVRIEADVARDGMCRDNLFAGACGAFAGDIERIAFEQVVEQINAFVDGAAELTGLLDENLTNGVCAIVTSYEQDCSRLENIVLDGNGDMLLFFEP